ncbi:hypothetical protein [Rhizobium sp. BK418]|uniref:hypothetical protein n=1 Tax=Rhizobium sp. BK418 TaxID=2512120 RepID=UPI00104B6FD8|nr:hypothetical protein [Rhizobium sp. BK418]
MIVLIQLLSFAQSGIYGSDWVFSFIVAAVFGLLGTRRITGASGPESSTSGTTVAQRPVAESSTSHSDALFNTAPNKPKTLEEHWLLFQNGEALGIEIQWRAEEIMSLIPKPFFTKPESETEGGMWANREAFVNYWFLRERAWLLTVGLVAIRRAQSDANYVGSVEYIELRHRVFLYLADEFNRACKVLGWPVELEALTVRLSNDLDAVSSFVADAARAAVSGEPGRAKPFIEWIKEQGLDVSDEGLVKNALRTPEEWKSDLPVSAYPA